MIVGVDATMEMLRVASKETPNLVQAQVPRLPFADESFDVVLAGFVVSHFESYVETNSVRSWNTRGTHLLESEQNRRRELDPAAHRAAADLASTITSAVGLLAKNSHMSAIAANTAAT